MSSSGSRNRSRSNNSKSPHERVFINRSKPVGAGLLNLGKCVVPDFAFSTIGCRFAMHHSYHSLPISFRFQSGNTCFLNSVLQALSHCDFLINAIDSSHHSEHCTGSAG